MNFTKCPHFYSCWFYKIIICEIYIFLKCKSENFINIPLHIYSHNKNNEKKIVVQRLFFGPGIAFQYTKNLLKKNLQRSLLAALEKQFNFFSFFSHQSKRSARFVFSLHALRLMWEKDKINASQDKPANRSTSRGMHACLPQ